MHVFITYTQVQVCGIYSSQTGGGRTSTRLAGAFTTDKQTLHIHKRALHLHKRVLHLRKRALSLSKRALHVRKRALHLRKRPLYLRNIA